MSLRQEPDVQRRSGVTIPGCRPSLNGGNLITSTGNAALDAVIGGGCPVGGILLVEEDKYCNYAKILSRYFLAESVRNKHGLFLCSLDDDPKQILRTVPRQAAQEKVKAAENVGQIESEDMRIAFRYNQLPKVDSEISGSSTVFYDLSLSIQESEMTGLDIQTYGECAEGFFKNLKGFAEQGKYSKDGGTKLLRICVNSFGSPLWYQDTNFGQFLLRTLLRIKSLVRSINSVCFVTIPSHLLQFIDPQLVQQIRNLVDISVEIESFAASEKETNPVFNDYHGLLHIRKLAALDTLAAFCPETTDMAFKLRRKKFVIEKLHLPPELGDGPDTPSKPPTMGCASTSSGTGNHLLDF